MHSIDLKLTLEIVLLGDLERPGQSITNILIVLVKVFIFNSQSVYYIRLDRLQNSWEEMFDVPIPWYRVYELIYKTTQDSRLCAFQTLCFSSQLFTFCFEDTESIDHLFWYCPQVACFWSQVQEWLKMHSIDLKLTLELVVLGDLERPGQSITDILILLVKVFIFNSQSVDSIRSDRLKLYIKHHSIVERYVLRRNPKWVASRDR